MLKFDMEQSRFLLSSRLYIIGLACLLIGIIFLGMSLYLLPVVFFDYNLDLPIAFFKLLHWFNHFLALTQDQIMRVIWVIIFFSGVFLILCADVISNYIDKKLLARGRRVRNMEKNMIDIRHILFILFLTMIISFLFFIIFEHFWIVNPPKK